MLAAVAAGAAVEGGGIDPEGGLAKDVEVADHLGVRGALQMDGLVEAAAVAGGALGQGPGDLQAVGVAVALVAEDADAVGEVEIESDAGHGASWANGVRGRAVSAVGQGWG